MIDHSISVEMMLDNALLPNTSWSWSSSILWLFVHKVCGGWAPLLLKLSGVGFFCQNWWKIILRPLYVDRCLGCLSVITQSKLSFVSFDLNWIRIRLFIYLHGLITIIFWDFSSFTSLVHRFEGFFFFFFSFSK